MAKRVFVGSQVDPGAEVAEGAEIGPGCVIEAGVRIGAGTRLIANVYLAGKVVIGERNVFYPGVCVGFEPQYRNFDAAKGTGGVVIGDDNVFREGVTIHRATGASPTRVGNMNYLMCNSHMGHDAAIGNGCTMANTAALAGHVTLQDKVTLGGGAMVHQFCRIGRLAMISGLVGIAQDVPPFCMSHSFRTVGSLNIVGLRRNGYREHLPALKQAFRIAFMSRHSTPVAAERIEKELGEDPLAKEFAVFLRGAKRGITPYQHSVGEGEGE